MNIKEAFQDTVTLNGESAYSRFIDNDHVNFMYDLHNLRFQMSPRSIVCVTEQDIISKYPSVFRKNDFNMFFAMYIRDPRIGLGEREVGRFLMRHQNIPIDYVMESGRADDILYIYDPEIVVSYIKKSMQQGQMYNVNLRKWLPRERSKKFNIIKRELRRHGISVKKYRKFISSSDTVESIRSRGEFPYYPCVPALSMIKHKKEFMKDDDFHKFLENVKNGKSSIKMSVSTPYDLYRSYRRDDLYRSYRRDESNDEQNSVFYNESFLALPNIEIGKMIAIVDSSYSMVNNDLLGKARAIGHYVARRSEYMKNHYIVFSNNSQIVKLTDDSSFSYIEDMEIMDRFHDYSNTNFQRVLENLEKVTEDIPDYILVLSDMQFDDSSGNNHRMLERLNDKGIRMIWWNLSINHSTFPTISPRGNIFVGGYSPRVLEMLSPGFDANESITRCVDEYKSKIQNILT